MNRFIRPRNATRRASTAAPFVALVAALLTLAATMSPAGACGGFFCQNNPVDQVAERIVFTVNDDDTVSSLIEISYFGEADDFSWILPIQRPITADDVAVPDDGELVFDELHRLTDVSILAPDPSQCVNDFLDQDFATAEEDASADFEAAGEVEVFASGEVGPFGFDVIGAQDPAALTDWLRDNNYRVDPSMEPLIQVYVEEKFSFIAMRLLDGETAESIQPVEITYPGTQPMIPLRLTAVAAQPNMPIYVWIFGDHQSVPENYEHFEIKTEELTFSPFGFSDYTQLISSRADAVGGRGFITEFAGPSESLSFADPYLVQKADEQPYVTRLTTTIDPEEMKTDPMFMFDESAEDVSNVRNARSLRGLYDCERDEALAGEFNGSDALDAQVINAQLRAGTFDGYENLSDDARLSRGERPDDDANNDNNNTDDGQPREAALVDQGGEGGLSTGVAVLLGGLGMLALIGIAAAAYLFGRRTSA